MAVFFALILLTFIFILLLTVPPQKTQVGQTANFVLKFTTDFTAK